MAKKKARRVNLSIPSDVANELDALGPVNKSKIAAKAFKAEVERIKREGGTRAVLRVLNFCGVPVTLTSENLSVTIWPSESHTIPRQKADVVILASSAMAATLRELGRTDVWST